MKDPEGLYNDFALNGEERRLANDRDWIGLIHYGVIFFSLEKMAAVLGKSNIDIYAKMSGKTVEEFQRTRNVSMKYSVAKK